MATQSFNDATKFPQEMEVITDTGKVYKGYFCDPKINRITLPKGWSAYDIRTDDDGCGVFVELKNGYVRVNNGGSFFMEGVIDELKNPGSNHYFRVDPDNWRQCHYDDEDDDLDESDCPENSPTDWEYSFC